MSSLRLERIRELLKEVVSEILLELKDPRLGFLSITDVEVSPDIKYAKVFVSVFGDDEAREKTMQGLRSASGFVRHELSRKVTMRHIPEVSFKLDTSIERGSRIIEMIGKVTAHHEDGDSSSEGGRPDRHREDSDSCAQESPTEMHHKDADSHTEAGPTPEGEA
jgi:ribosome-binding factor A